MFKGWWVSLQNNHFTCQFLVPVLWASGIYTERKISQAHTRTYLSDLKWTMTYSNTPAWVNQLDFASLCDLSGHLLYQEKFSGKSFLPKDVTQRQPLDQTQHLWKKIEMVVQCKIYHEEKLFHLKENNVICDSCHKNMALCLSEANSPTSQEASSSQRYHTIDSLIVKFGTMAVIAFHSRADMKQGPYVYGYAWSQWRK